LRTGHPLDTPLVTEQTASCTLPSGETVTVTHRVPLYTLARELDARGYGDWRLQSYTPTGTPSLRGLVSVMAGLTVSERDIGGMRLEKYRPFDRRGGLVQRDEGSGAVMAPLPAALISESTGAAA
jgi:hypothetical protein